MDEVCARMEPSQYSQVVRPLCEACYTMICSKTRVGEKTVEEGDKETLTRRDVQPRENVLTLTFDVFSPSTRIHRSY